MSNTLKDLVKEVQYRLDLTQGEVAKRIKYSREHFLTLLKKDSPEATKRMFLEFGDILQNVSGAGNLDQDVQAGSERPENKEGEGFYVDTITDLRRIGLRLSNTNEETSIANRILAENQRDLIQVIKTMHQPTADDVKENQDHPPLDLVIERIAQLGAPRYWKTPAAGKIILGKFLSGAEFLKRE